MIEIDHLTKKYGEHVALSDVSLRLDTGVYGLLGANGAGKSTLLNLITDNVKRTSGSIRYNGKEILKQGASYRKDLGYMPQLQGMYEDFTAGAFLRYIGALKGVSIRECKSKALRCLEIAGLSNVAHKKLGGFSGGMRQRVLLAAALLDDPKILILDEPTAGLDPEERIRLRDHIAHIAGERTVILATHVVSDIESIAQRVILLKNGQVIAFASPAELIEKLRQETKEPVRDLEDVYLHYCRKGTD